MLKTAGDLDKRAPTSANKKVAAYARFASSGERDTEAGSAAREALSETAPRGRKDSFAPGVARYSAIYYNRVRDKLIR